MLGNKEIMAKNIKTQMELHEVNATDVCNALGFKQNTFSDWVNGKSYPRIDKIEMMANYFGVSKSALVEEQVPVDYMMNDDQILIEVQKLSRRQKLMLLRHLMKYEQDYLEKGMWK